MRQFQGLLWRKRKRQRSFEFLEATRRHERSFKWIIVGITLVAVLLPLALLPRGRYLVAEAAAFARKGGRLAVNEPIPRDEVDQHWDRIRRQGIADSRRRLIEIYESTPPPYQGLMRYAGLDPDHGLLRWGNYDQTLLLPSTVFEPDEAGRSYRLRPCTDSIWLREVAIQGGVLTFFLVPDRQGLEDAIRGTAAIPVMKSKQSTNSWGLRGPEPELDAPLRGIVLGDSYMQALFIGDHETPSECLKRYLEAKLKTRTSILNTGVLGYSPEQYYFSLVAFADRFRPQFVVVSFFANDFGECFEVTQGRGDWAEGKYWLDKIARFAQSRGWPCLFVPTPVLDRTLGRRKNGYYPGMISNVLETSGIVFLNPAEAFVNEHLRLLTDLERRGERASGCLLFNGHIGDGHFSALGAEVWAESVGRRLSLLIERKGDRE
jgi:hypothetical protein